MNNVLDNTKGKRQNTHTRNTNLNEDVLQVSEGATALANTAAANDNDLHSPLDWSTLVCVCVCW